MSGQDMVTPRFDPSKLSNEDAYAYKLSEPIFLTNVMVNHPVILIIMAFMVMILISLVVISLEW